MPAWLLTPSGIMGTVIAALLLTNTITYSLWESVNDKYSSLKASMALAQEQAEQDAARLKANQDRILADYGAGWSAATARRPVVRVLRAGGDLPQGAAVSTAADRPDAAAVKRESGAGQDEAIAIAVEECERVTNNAVTDAAQVLWLERWIQDQHDASR